MLALLASSSECELVFNKLLITSIRNRLNSDIVEVDECLKSWFVKEGGQEPTEEGIPEGDWGGKNVPSEGDESSCDEKSGVDFDSSGESEDVE
jgi:hypothetical protein